MTPLEYLDSHIEDGRAGFLRAPSERCMKYISHTKHGATFRCDRFGRWRLPRSPARGVYCAQHAASLLRHFIAKGESDR